MQLHHTSPLFEQRQSRHQDVDQDAWYHSQCRWSHRVAVPVATLLLPPPPVVEVMIVSTTRVIRLAKGKGVRGILVCLTYTFNSFDSGISLFAPSPHCLHLSGATTTIVWFHIEASLSESSPYVCALWPFRRPSPLKTISGNVRGLT